MHFLLKSTVPRLLRNIPYAKAKAPFLLASNTPNKKLESSAYQTRKTYIAKEDEAQTRYNRGGGKVNSKVLTST